ncbi:MAG: hypothetical protein ABJP02_04980 [Parasphingorhabdus sp.]|uniref:hypothetical protein n=1 Tax=Parasphingorhabdus sp. TaxID=2709688 RepID=UPI0032993AA8
MIDPNRGTGRTTRSLKRVPDGGYFILRSMRMADYCRGILFHLGRDPKSVQFVPLTRSEISLRGRSEAFEVDHHCYDPPHSRVEMQSIDWLHAFDEGRTS